jgi:TPR repeat protein
MNRPLTILSRSLTGLAAIFFLGGPLHAQSVAAPPGQAEYQRGVDYENGHHVAQSDSLARVWYVRAAELGYPSAEEAVGRMHECFLRQVEHQVTAATGGE